MSDWPCDLLLREILPHEGTEANLPHYYSAAILQTPTGPVFVRLIYEEATYILSLSADKSMGFTTSSGHRAAFLMEVRLNNFQSPESHRLSWCKIEENPNVFTTHLAWDEKALDVLDPQYYGEVIRLRASLLDITKYVLSSSWWPTLKAATNLWHLSHLRFTSHEPSRLTHHALAQDIRSLPKSAQALLLAHESKPLREMAVQIIFAPPSQ